MTRQPDKSYEPFERKSKIFFMLSKLVFDTMSNMGFIWTVAVVVGVLVVVVDDGIEEESNVWVKVELTYSAVLFKIK